MAEKKTKQQGRQDGKVRRGIMVLLQIAVILFILFAVVSIVRVQNNIVEKKRELAQIEADIEIMKARNAELEDIIEADDIGRYMEKLAVEQNGYAYPDEKRYYDTSRD